MLIALRCWPSPWHICACMRASWLSLWRPLSTTLALANAFSAASTLASCQAYGLHAEGALAAGTLSFG